MVFDTAEVAAYYPGLVGDTESLVVMRWPELVEMYVGYFRRLWVDAFEFTSEMLADAEPQSGG
jgi:hypothetical protein